MKQIARCEKYKKKSRILVNIILDILAISLECVKRCIKFYVKRLIYSNCCNNIYPVNQVTSIEMRDREYIKGNHMKETFQTVRHT